MNCANCGTPATEGDQFCGNCGASLAQAPPAAHPQPTQPLPQQQAYQQPEQPAQPASPQPTQPIPQPTYQQPAQPQASYQQAPRAAGSKAPLIVALSIVGVLVVIGLAAGGFFAWRALNAAEEPPATAAITETGDAENEADTAQTETEPSTSAGYATAEQAVAAAAPEGWVYDVLEDQGNAVEYVVGPPNSEYTDVIVVEQQADGSWVVVNTYPFEMDEGDDGSADSGMTPEDEATQVVGEFLYAVKEDRADDAHEFTVPPFSEDPASAQYSNGDLASIEVLSATMQGDGSVLVRSREMWTWGTEEWIYVCVPTEYGYRISEMRTP